MYDTQALLDEALVLGDLELRMLGQGEVEQAQETAQCREDLIAQALGNSPCTDLTALKDKLEQLMALQGRLTGEARQLHESIRDELLRTRMENDRVAGYGKANKDMSLFTSMLHKRG
jgi:hypothetical protein